MSEIYKIGKLILTDKVLENVYLEVKDGKFMGLYENDSQLNGEYTLIDYSNKIVGPGFVETHIHGYLGKDVMDGEIEGLNTIARGLLSTGVTSWLPTTLTSSCQSLNDVCQLIGENYQNIKGAKIQGIFLEGPYFTTKHKGAQNPDYMSDPVIEELKNWQALSNQMIKKIALAPEREHVIPFVEYAQSQNIKVGLAHSEASFKQAEKAVKAGANIFVHTYNGMSGLHHREPGMVGAAMTLEHCYAEVIADGQHVHPKAIEVLVKSRGVEEVILITDSMRAAGLGDGRSRLGEFEVEVKDGCARLVEGGSLAGSILKMNEAVKNIVDWGIVDLPSAVRMASINAAKSVGIEEKCGAIKLGFDADFIVLNQNNELEATYLNGQKVYEAHLEGNQ
ncbi:N-acetylglucosamine-6-phosphate deacetylase [Globicatella sulfidifaciens]